jgi:hypothetical protein
MNGEQRLDSVSQALIASTDLVEVLGTKTLVRQASRNVKDSFFVRLMIGHEDLARITVDSASNYYAKSSRPHPKRI